MHADSALGVCFLLRGAFACSCLACLCLGDAAELYHSECSPAALVGECACIGSFDAALLQPGVQEVVLGWEHVSLCLKVRTA